MLEIQTREISPQSSLTILVSTKLQEKRIPHAFSTRMGGVSAPPKNELNLSYREDKAEWINENRNRFRHALPFPQRKLLTPHQTHSDLLAHVSLPDVSKSEVIEVDSLATTDPQIYIGVKVADCLPVLIADIKTGLVAAIHAGWRGTLKKITLKTIQDLQKNHHIESRHLIVALGPSACGDCYEVGADVADSFRQEFTDSEKFLKKAENGKFLLNVKEVNRQQLLGAGISNEQIDQGDWCTLHHNHLFFSHRLESPSRSVKSYPVGRFLAVIGPPEKH